MEKFVIITDSCSDLDKELREKYDIEYVPMHFMYEGKDMRASLDWDEISAPDFYNIMRGGVRITTAAVNANTYREAFEKFLQEGCDILSISCSSALSNSVETSCVVRDELLKKYPERKIVCIDSLISCYGLGILCIRASELRAEGKTIEETAQWVLSNRKKIHQECTVEKLSYLKQAGRVSAASAFFGGLLNVKPIIISDVNGNNAAVEKVKGRMTSIEKLTERFKEQYESVPYQKVFFSHADSEEDAKLLKEKVLAACPDKNVDVHFGYIGPIVGASCGPGTIAVYFFGKEVTFDSKKK